MLPSSPKTNTVILSTQDGVQVIVIEHAGEDAWKNIKHVTKKREQRDDGVALIPQTWLRDLVL